MSEDDQFKKDFIELIKKCELEETILHKGNEEKFFNELQKLNTAINPPKPETRGRKAKPDKKVAISIKLPPSLIQWMDSQEQSRAVLIESAFKGKF